MNVVGDRQPAKF